MKRILALVPLLCLTVLGQDADFRRQVQSTSLTRQLLQKSTAQQIRDLLNVSDIGSELTTKTNLAALAAHTGATNYQVMTVLGASTVGDWGQPKLWYLDTSATTTNQISITNAGGSGCWIHPWDGDVRAFGATPFTAYGTSDNTTDDTAAINAAADYAAGQTGSRILILPAGDYRVTNSLRLVQSRLRVMGSAPVTPGDSDAQYPNVPQGRNLGPTRIILEDNSNVPFIVAGSTNGLYNRQPNDPQEDGSFSDCYEYGSLIENIVFYCNGANQTRYDCHGLKLENVWNVTIQDCAIVAPSGYRVWLKDCNQIHLKRVSGGGGTRGSGVDFYTRGMFVWGSADCVFEGNVNGFVGGPVAWFTGSSSWQNHVSGNLWFNTPSAWWAVTNVSTVNGTITLSTNHTYETGMPVELLPRDGGSMAGGVEQQRPYWAIKVSSNSLRLATTSSNAAAGNALIPTTTGTNLVIWHGPGAGAYLSWNAGNMAFVGNRFDQNDEAGVWANDSQNLVLSANNATLNGIDNITGAAATNRSAGVILSGFANSAVIAGNVFNRIEPNYPQNYGVWVKTNPPPAGNVLSVTYPSTLGPNTLMSGATNLLFDSTTDATRYTFNHRGAAEIGTTNNGVALRVVGNASGVPVLELAREVGSVGTIGIGVASGGFNVQDRTSSRGMMYLDTTANASTIYLGGVTAVASPRLGEIASESASGTDVRGGPLRFKLGAGTGGAYGTNMSFMFPIRGASGASAQSHLTLMRLSIPDVPLEGDTVIEVSQYSTNTATWNTSVFSRLCISNGVVVVR